MTRLGALLAALLVAVLALPAVALVLSASMDDVVLGLRHPLFVDALTLSLGTTLLSLTLIVACGTPLAWWLARTGSRASRAVELVVELPIVLPPAVVGVALLAAFGRQGLLGSPLEAIGIGLPFTPGAVVLAQVVVAAPFYVQAASNAFRAVDPDLMLVARSLGASPGAAFLRVAVPVALPGLVVGAALSWARALGEFGATLLFAGNMPGLTQTMPLAIFAAMESDTRLAVVFALVLGAMGGALLLLLRAVPLATGKR